MKGTHTYKEEGTFPITTTFTGTGNYTGNTTISNGTLQLGDGTNGHDGSIINSPSCAGTLKRNSSIQTTGVTSRTASTPTAWSL